MNRLRGFIAVLGVAVVILSGCGAVTPGQKTRAVNLLIATKGKVQLERENWRNPVPVAIGTILHSTDLLDVNGSVSVLCADLSVQIIDDRGSPPCPVDQGVLIYDGTRFNSFQRSDASDPINTPYIMYPRNTFIFDARPLLRWHATGITNYKVAIEAGGKTIWSQDHVSADSIRYPDDAPALQPDMDYLLTVQDNTTGRSSREDPAKGLGFRLLGGTERQEVERQRDRIMTLALDEPARHLALAVYYAGLSLRGERALWGEAWQLLEEVAQARDAPAIHLLSGSTLSAMKLPNEAEIAYRIALEHAEALGDTETQAAAKAALWRLTGNQAWLDEAIKLYDSLGDQSQVESLRKENKP